MPKQERHKDKSKRTPYQVDPEQKVTSRRASVRNAENFEEVLGKFESALIMGDKSSQVRPPGQGGVNNEGNQVQPVLQAEQQGPQQVGGIAAGDLNAKSGEVAPPQPGQDHEEGDDTDLEEATTLANALTELRKRRVKPKKRLLAFSSVTGVSRRMLNELGVIVSLYREVKDIEREISDKYSEWLIVCGKDETVLEDENNPLKPSVMDKEIEDMGELVDKVEEAFKLVKNQYSEKQEVIDYLDFVEAVPKQLELGGLQHQSPAGSAVSESAALGRGEQYLRTKIPILKTEIENRYGVVKEQFEAKSYTTENALQDAIKKLEIIDKKITEESTFEKLLRELFEFSKEEFNQHEEWRQVQLGLLASLTSSFEKSMEEK